MQPPLLLSGYQVAKSEPAACNFVSVARVLRCTVAETYESVGGMYKVFAGCYYCLLSLA